MSGIVRRLKTTSGPVFSGLAIALLVGSGGACSFAGTPAAACPSPAACLTATMPDCDAGRAVHSAVVPEAGAADTPVIPGDGAVAAPTLTPRLTRPAGRGFAPADAAGSIQEYFHAAHPCRAPPRSFAR